MDAETDTAYRRVAWLNILPESSWAYVRSVGPMRRIVDGRKYPLTLGGIEAATRVLSR